MTALPDIEIVKLARDLGLAGLIYIPKPFGHSRHQRLVHWMLIKLEDNYELYGDRPRNRIEMRSIFKMASIKGFVEASEIDRKGLNYAQGETWRQFKRWWDETDDKTGERGRVGRISDIDVTLLSSYRKVRRSIRLEKDFGLELINELGEYAAFIGKLAKESCASWSKKSELPADFLDLCHRKGVGGRNIYISKASPKSHDDKLVQWMLEQLECNYESTGLIMRRDAEFKIFFRRARFPECYLLETSSARTLQHARKKTLRCWLSWIEGEETRLKGESMRVVFENPSNLLIYRAVRSKLRLADVLPDLLTIESEVREKIVGLAQRSLEASWRV